MHNCMLDILLIFWWTQQGLAGAVHFWAALWNMLAPSFKGSITQLIWSELCPVCTALSLFFFPSSQGVASLQVLWSHLPSPLCFRPRGRNSWEPWWLTDSHGPDSGSDWSSRCSSHTAAEYSSLRPFLVPSATVHSCCTKQEEWVPSFVSWFLSNPVRQ